MKTNVILIAMLVVMSSCFMVIEPVYDYRDRLTGSYTIEEHSQTYHDQARFYIDIRKSGISDDVVIKNFYNTGINVSANVSFDKIYIYRQLLNGYEIEGVGTFYGDEIRFSYSVRDTYSNSSPTDFCNAIAWFL